MVAAKEIGMDAAITIVSVLVGIFRLEKEQKMATKDFLCVQCCTLLQNGFGKSSISHHCITASHREVTRS